MNASKTKGLLGALSMAAVGCAVLYTQDFALTQSSNTSIFHAQYKGQHLNHPIAIFKRPASQYLFIADSGNHQIKVFEGGPSLVTLAGNGSQGTTDGAASSAEFYLPMGIDGPGLVQRADPSGGAGSAWFQLTIYDTGNSRIRKVCVPLFPVDPRVPPPCSSATVSTVSTSVINPGHGIGIATPSQPYYFANSGNHSVSQLNGSSVTTLAGNGSPGFTNGSLSSAQFSGPAKVAAGPGSILFVLDTGNHVIRAINTSSSQVTTFAGSGSPGYQDGPASSAKFATPTSGTYNPADGYFYVADTTNNCIRRIDGSGNVSTYAGAKTPGHVDGALSSAKFSNPSDLIVDGTTMFVADSSNNAIRAINMSTGMVSTYIQ